MKVAKNPHGPAEIKRKKSQPAEARSLVASAPLAEVAIAGVPSEATVTRVRNEHQSIIDQTLRLLSSVPFGLMLLALLIVVCMIGMLIQQQELESFANYYAALTPAEKLVYGRLGFFNIYHTWCFNLSLLLLSLNIILASIDHFPKTWSFIRRKKLTASPPFTQAQRVHDVVELRGVGRGEMVDRVRQAVRALQFKVRVTEEETRTTVFAERGVWNRLGAYAIHTALLTIFLGGFLTAKYGHTGGMWLAPGQTRSQMTQQVYNVDAATNNFATREQSLQLPFEVKCLDIQQKLIDQSRFIDAMNTIDWLTRVEISDETGKHEALIHLNKPYDYRGYRLFQASFQAVGSARLVNLRVTPEAGGAPQNVALKLNDEATLADGTRIRYTEFNPDFQLGQDKQPVVASAGYNNPAAYLEVTRPNGDRREAWAFTESFIKTVAEAPVMKSALLNTPGWQFVLTNFEKASQAHMLSVQYDPGSAVVYLGFALLCLTLVWVFFTSHQRLWVVVEGEQVYLGGEANRNRLGFEDRVRKMAAFASQSAECGEL